MTDQPQNFEAWALVEIFGHSQIAGKVTNQTVGSCSFVRVDVAEVDGRNGVKIPAFTQLLGEKSIFRMTLCTEETARKAAAAWRAAPFIAFEAPTVPAITHQRYEDPNDDDDDYSDPMDMGDDDFEQEQAHL